MTKIISRTSTPPHPDFAWLARLEQHMWISSRDVTYGRSGCVLDVYGILTPDPDATDAAALRRSFLATFEAVLSILDELGAHHTKHPEFSIRGRVKTGADGKDEFQEISCKADFQICIKEH